jgi:hypothetical protein
MQKSINTQKLVYKTLYNILYTKTKDFFSSFFDMFLCIIFFYEKNILSKGTENKFFSAKISKN